MLNIDISGYTFIHIDSPTTAGGVAMYISNALQFSAITNLQLTVNECENIWIKLHDSNVIISTIYRVATETAKSNSRTFQDFFRSFSRTFFFKDLKFDLDYYSFMHLLF